MQIVKALSNFGINQFKEEEGELHVNGVQHFQKATYSDQYQLMLATRLQVVSKVAIMPYELYEASDGHTKVQLMTGEQLLHICRLVG